MNKLSLTLRIFISYFILIATAATAILWFTVVQIEDAVTETAQQEFEEDFQSVAETVFNFYEETYGADEEIQEAEIELPEIEIEAAEPEALVTPQTETTLDDENLDLENVDETSGSNEEAGEEEESSEGGSEENTDDEGGDDDNENPDDEEIDDEEIDGEDPDDEEIDDEEIDNGDPDGEDTDDEEIDDEGTDGEGPDDEEIDDEEIDDEDPDDEDTDGEDSDNEDIDDEDPDSEDPDDEESDDEDPGDEDPGDEEIDDEPVDGEEIDEEPIEEEETEEEIDESGTEDANLQPAFAAQLKPSRQAALAARLPDSSVLLLQDSRIVLPIHVTQQQIVDAETERLNYQEMISTLQEQANLLGLHVRLLSVDGTIAHYDSATRQQGVPVPLTREVLHVIEEDEAWFDPSQDGLTIIGAEYVYLGDEPVAMVWTEAPWETVVTAAQTQRWGLIGGTSLVSLILLLLLGGGLARVVTQPITELRETAQQMAAGNLDARANTDAPSEVRRLAEDFNSMATAVERMMAEQRAFASNAAHELRTPLTAIRLRTETLLEDDPDEELQERYVHEIQLEAQRLGRLVDDLRVLSQADSQRLKIGQEQVDVSQIISILEREFSRQITEKSLDFTTHVGAGPFVMQGSTAHIRTIMRNIVENAVKYTPENGRVKLNLYRVADRITVDIQDSGIGIPKEDLPQLFQRFYRVDKAHSRTIPGSGLGLSLVRSIIDLYGGQIKIDSDGLGMGTTVRIALPVAQPEASSITTREV